MTENQKTLDVLSNVPLDLGVDFFLAPGGEAKECSLSKSCNIGEGMPRYTTKWGNIAICPYHAIRLAASVLNEKDPYRRVD
jgi:hypothetical protein